MEQKRTSTASAWKTSWKLCFAWKLKKKKFLYTYEVISGKSNCLWITRNHTEHPVNFFYAYTNKETLRKNKWKTVFPSIGEKENVSLKKMCFSFTLFFWVAIIVNRKSTFNATLFKFFFSFMKIIYEAAMNNTQKRKIMTLFVWGWKADTQNFRHKSLWTRDLWWIERLSLTLEGKSVCWLTNFINHPCPLSTQCNHSKEK